jgi:hypothetical protein
MVHYIFAVVGNTRLSAEIAAQSGSPYVASLREDLSIVGLGDEQLDVLAGVNFDDCVAGFDHLNPELQRRLAEASHRGDLVYLETQYTGGSGAQAAAFFRAGRLFWSEYESSAVRITRSSPINRALRELGVIAKAGIDEFDTVGLTRFRTLSRFLATTIAEQ